MWEALPHARGRFPKGSGDRQNIYVGVSLRVIHLHQRQERLRRVVGDGDGFEEPRGFQPSGFPPKPAAGLEVVWQNGLQSYFGLSLEEMFQSIADFEGWQSHLLGGE